MLGTINECATSTQNKFTCILGVVLDDGECCTKLSDMPAAFIKNVEIYRFSAYRDHIDTSALKLYCLWNDSITVAHSFSLLGANKF